MEAISSRINFLGFEVREEEGPPPDVDEQALGELGQEYLVFESFGDHSPGKAEFEHKEFSSEFV